MIVVILPFTGCSMSVRTIAQGENAILSEMDSFSGMPIIVWVKEAGITRQEWRKICQ